MPLMAIQYPTGRLDLLGNVKLPVKYGRVKRWQGQMGSVKKTLQSLEVVRVDSENNLLLIKGAVPGATGADLIVKPAVKARGD